MTREQALGSGLSDNAIANRVARGWLYRVHRAVYAVGHPPATPLERASAAVLACGDGAALSHGSAMVLWGFWNHWYTPLEVVVWRERRLPGIKIHRSRTHAWRDFRRHHGIRATTPARTLLDIAPRLDARPLKRAVSNALNSPWLTESQLAELLARCSRVRSAGRIASLIGLPGTPTRAGWEDDFPEFCSRYGLPQPVMGARVGGYIVDALFADERVIVELDSWGYHQGKIAFETDRERDAETLARGLVTVRCTWARIHRAAQREAERLHAILAARRAQAA